MLRSASRVGSRPLALTLLSLLALATLAACADGAAPTAPERSTELAARDAATSADAAAALATLRRVTARYHDLDAALDDDFVLLHECESIEGEGPVGIVYFSPERTMDGVVDVTRPDALIYEPSGNGKPTLVGVEFAVPNLGQPAPQFLGATFQNETDIGVYALHVWVWRPNPAGMFAETNSRVSCGVE